MPRDIVMWREIVTLHGTVRSRNTMASHMTIECAQLIWKTLCSPVFVSIINLVWFFLSTQVPPKYEKTYPIFRDQDQLYHSSLGMTFTAEPRHFTYGIMKLKCTATVSEAYSLSSEEIVAAQDAKAAGTTLRRGFANLPPKMASRVSAIESSGADQTNSLKPKNPNSSKQEWKQPSTMTSSRQPEKNKSKTKRGQFLFNLITTAD